MKYVPLAGAVLALSASLALAAPAAKETFQYFTPEATKALSANKDEGTLIVDVGSFSEEFVDHTHSSAFETHDRFIDHVTVIGGVGSILVGGTVSDNKQVSPGEWRGEVATGAKDYPLVSGSILVIPAGTPHKFVVPAGGHLAFTLMKNRLP